MKIGIDARMYGPEQAGLGRYVQELVLGLVKFDTENEHVVFMRTTHECDFTNNTNIQKVVADIPWYSWQEQLKFSKIIKKEKIDLMHFPHWNVPLFYNKPFVVTVHDLIMYHYPRHEASTHGVFVYWLKDKLHRLVLRHAVRKAKQIIVTSEFTKQDLHKTLGVPEEKMMVIYQSPFQISNFKFQISNRAQNLKDKVVTERFGVHQKYVLYVGNAYPHKNLEGLLKAWKIFCDKYGEDYQLVLVGKKNFFYNKIISNLTIWQCSNVIFTDYVTDEELSNLYQNASLYVFPSLYEGFGLPPLEAMSYGIPVASSNASCLPEILGEGALYFDPLNYEQMAEIIYKGLTDENIRIELVENAKQELKRYSTFEFVKGTMDIYKKALSLE